MRTFLTCCLTIFVGASAIPAFAEAELHGYAEAALVAAPPTVSWRDGGYGKLPWGGDGRERNTNLEITAADLEARATLPFDLSVSADIRYQPRQKAGLDLIDATVMWHPPASGPWSWSAKIGVFFAPFGLENTELGWSSPWTVSNSAIASWTGEELRTIGGEVTLRRQFGRTAISFSGAVFGWNDIAGVLIADHGWDIGTQPTGLFDHQRVPNALIRRFGGTPPGFTPEFRETDDDPGWYAGFAVSDPDLGRLQAFRYDNDTDPASERDEAYGWRTRFWEVGYTRAFGQFYLIGEAIWGETIISPDGFGPFRTGFHAASLLLGWTEGDWRVAGRFEPFGTTDRNTEHGWETTASVSWSPEDWLRLSAELVVIDLYRAGRKAEHSPPHVIETMPLLALRGQF